jgi:hypothetical protein
MRSLIGHPANPKRFAGQLVAIAKKAARRRAPRTSSVRHDDMLQPASESMKLVLYCREKTPMAVRSPKDTWFVSFEQNSMRPAKRSFTRATETFHCELDAKKFAKQKLTKKFAKQKLTQTQNVSAGTLNPHLPKRVISSAQMVQWLDEPAETDGVP